MKEEEGKEEKNDMATPRLHEQPPPPRWPPIHEIHGHTKQQFQPEQQPHLHQDVSPGSLQVLRPRHELFDKSRAIERNTQKSVRLLSFSSTIQEDVYLPQRIFVVLNNLVIMLISFAVFWFCMAVFWARHSHPSGFWYNLTSTSLVFMFMMYLEIPLAICSLFLFTTAAVGFLGSLRENLTLLGYHNGLLIFFIILNSISAMVISIAPHTVRNQLKTSAYVDIIKSYRDNLDFQHMIDSIQESLRCCGLSDDSFRDWNHNRYFHCSEDNPSRERCGVPRSCCRKNTTDPSPPTRLCGFGVLLLGDHLAWLKVYTRSCADGALSYVLDNLVVFLTIGMLVNFFALLMLTMSIVLEWEIKNLKAIYESYYSTVHEGQQVMKEMNVPLPPLKRIHVQESRGPLEEMRHSFYNVHVAAAGGIQRASAALCNYLYPSPKPKQQLKP